MTPKQRSSVFDRSRTLAWASAVAGLLSGGLTMNSDGAEDYLFTSFRGNGEDGLHLAGSTNGYIWHELGGGKSYLRPEVGGKLMRDPCLARGDDGTFHLVWTTSWTAESGKVFGYASSRDLRTWSPQRAISVMEKEPATRNIWAPELFFDRGNRQWLIFWSSTIPGRFADSDQSGDDGYNHRFYYVATKEFVTFGPSKLLHDPGFNCIDATLLSAAGQFYLIFKDERKNPLQKNLRWAVAPSPTGPFGAASEPFTSDWVEGPSAIKIGDEYLVYFDHYAGKHYYGAVRSKDLRHWKDCSAEMQFPSGHRHGTVLRIPSALADTLRAAGE